jgi:hypothetical protein
MRRSLFNALASMSLVLCVAIIGLWVRSYLPIYLENDCRDGKWCMLFHDEAWAETMNVAYGVKSARNPTYARVTWNVLGFEVIKGGSPTSSDNYCLIAIPLPYLMIVLSLPPIAWFVRARRDRGRAKAGRCIACGYDLRASPERCPECGAVPEKAA